MGSDNGNKGGCDWGTNLFAYLLLLVGGLGGAHHAYLGRQYQALVWATTGGMFGVGILRDLISIPRYVREINSEDGM